jgi:hypothetical protein
MSTPGHDVANNVDSGLRHFGFHRSPPKPLEFFMGSIWIATIQALLKSVVNLPANVQYGEKGKNLT